VDSLANSHAGAKRFLELIQSLTEQLTQVFRGFRVYGENRALTLVFAGFGPPGIFAAQLSNLEDSKGNRLHAVSDDFHFRIFLRNNRQERKLMIGWYGAEEAIPPDLTDAIKKVARRCFHYPPKDRAAVLADLARRAANNKSFGWKISKDCFSVVTTPQGGFLARDHPESSAAVLHSPHYVGRSLCVKDIEVRRRDP
jgi:hypothetical protein